MQIVISLFGGVISIGLGWLALRETAWNEVYAGLVGFPKLPVVVALLLVIASALLRAIRWKILFLRARIGIFRLFYLETAALGLNIISPIRWLDEPMLFGILTVRDRMPGSTVLATMLASRVLDLSVSVLFGTVAILAHPALLKFIPGLIVVALALTIWVAFLWNVNRIIRNVPLLRRLAGVKRFQASLRRIWRQKRRLTTSFLASAGYWLMLGPVSWIIAQGAGLEISFFEATIVLLGAIFFATSIPGLPGAIGTFEFAVLNLLTVLGVEHSPGFVTYALMLHAVTVVPPACFTVIVLPLEGIKSVQALRKTLAQGRETRARIGGG
jgi:uncharacterized protein (TIRG00374 family)